ncbi:hypothetical protein ASZ90_005192 [hydrocarbon metagenome]|uniref:LTD domain-containing protein n=1 Tax=hydrocarbon metagenome TaxID=938273 RepID=A0A0W8FVZ1_9ZZZZ
MNNLASGDSVIQNFNLGSFSQGDLQLIGVVNFGLDEDESNNELIKEFEILPPPPPFNAIVINEIMYAPPTGEPEWVEIYNNSNQTYNLANWKFADFAGSAVITVDPITIDPGEFIVLAKNATISDFFDIDATIIVMNLPVLNNDWDRAVLMDNNSFIVDSLTYLSSWGGLGGRSLERIDYDSPSHDPANWGTAVTPDRATPGKINSISPKDFDLALTDITITPSPPIANEDLTANVKVKNIGKNQANTYTIRLYNDTNFDSTPQPEELINSFHHTNLASGDSLTQEFVLGDFPIGEIQLIGLVIFAADEDESNNEVIFEFTVSPPPPPFNAIVINEIMYAPPTGEPEWVEIYNRSNQSYDLANWKFSDAGATAVITAESIIIAPNEYIVIAKDSSVINHYTIDSKIIVFNLPVLNNTGDRAVLMDNNSFIVDSLTYLSSWGGLGGRSLERIDIDEPSHEPANWGTSVSPNRATPGRINSLSPKDHDLAVTDIKIIPSPPIEYDELTAQLTVKNLGRLNALSFSVNLYNDINFDGIPQQGELIESFDHINFASGDSLIKLISLGSFPSTQLQLIGEVIYNLDEDVSNNRLIYEFTVYPPPPAYNDIVINEIMYAPLTGSGEPEWVEIYNRSENTYLLTNWKFADASGSATITNEFITIGPSEYIVLSKDSSILNFYNIDAKIIVMNLPVLNNTGDDVILLNEYSIVIDSLRYSSSWGGSTGRSLERIDVYGESTLQSNWAQSISSAGATPGKENSVAPREFDLAVVHFNSVNSFLLLDEPSVFDVRVRNNGTSNISGGELNIYFDRNYDSLFTEDELIESFTGLTLEAGQEVTEQFSYTFNSIGPVGLLAVVNHPSDNYQPNDSVYLYKEVVKPHVNRGEIVVNEFMYAPMAPYPEWIELYNTSSTAYQLRDFQIADLNDTVVISTQNILLPANSYIVIARDSIITMLYDIPSQVIIRSFPVLNNSGDRIMLLDNYDRVIDSLNYTSQWGGTNGRSLERINPFGSSTEPSNWITSTDPSNGTPGKINSVAPKDYDVAIKEFYSNPEQPVVGETVTLFVDLLNDGLNTASFDLKLFESNSSSEKVSFLEVINIENLTPGETRTVKFNYQIESFIEDKFFIAEADYPDDQNISNNSSLLFISSTVAPLSLIINEIMYAPEGDEPEWIELYNNSENSINLKDWRVSDVISTPSVTTITRENVYVDPGKFVVLSKDSGIYNFYPNLKEGVILVNFAILNNTEDGIVIYDRFGNTIDSVFYNNQFSRKAGHSIERLDYNGPSIAPSNWNYSIAAQKGTPGFINSRVPKNYDLVMEDIFLTPKFPEMGEQITISMYITNAGLFDVSDYSVIFEADFGVYEEFQGQFLQSGETDLITVSSYYQMPESFAATATINFPLDENLTNNTLTKTFYSGYSTSSVLINEVLYAPTSGGTEWVELINASNIDINLKGWRIAEGSTYNSPRLITGEDIIVKPGEYIIIADDTSGGKFISQTGVHIFQLDFGILNTTEDIITIFDFRGALIDSLKYFSSWGATTGISLERLSLDSPTNDRLNWLPSITLGGSTPGTTNSTINLKQLDEDQKVVINEIMFNPETDNSEFIEFFNTSDEYIEIANWVVEDAAKNRTNLTRTSYVINPKSYFVVAADSSILFNYPELNGFNQLIIANRNLSLNNSDDLVLLTDAFGETVDSVRYFNDWHNSRLVTTRNKSLERINPFINGNDDNNWSTSTDVIGATPGKENSIYIENKSSNKVIFVTPNPFSPDGDGFEDFTIINYKLPRDVSSIQIKVFDSKGRKVRTINESNLFGKEGSIIFDGYNDDRQPLKMGIYILLIEAVNSSSGTIDTFKEVVVVARKL